MPGGTPRDLLPQMLVRQSVLHPLRTLLVWAAILLVTGVGIASLEIDSTTDSVLDREDPAWDFYQASQARFGGDEIIVVALEGAQPYAASTAWRAFP